MNFPQLCCFNLAFGRFLFRRDHMNIYFVTSSLIITYIRMVLLSFILIFFFLKKQYTKVCSFSPSLIIIFYFFILILYIEGFRDTFFLLLIETWSINLWYLFLCSEYLLEICYHQSYYSNPFIHIHYIFYTSLLCPHDAGWETYWYVLSIHLILVWSWNNFFYHKI